MKILALTALVIAATLGGGQQFTSEDRYGKTIDEVIAMGHTKWHDWYTDESRGGGSTAGESFAEMIYADCLKFKNESWLKLVRSPTAALLVSIDPLFEAALIDAVEAGKALTGGGTMWNIIGASAQVSRQETVRDLIWPPNTGVSASQDSVWKAWRKALETIRKHKSDIEASSMGGGTTYEDAVKSLYKLNDNFSSVVTSIRGQKPVFKGRVFAFYKEMVDMVRLGV